MRDTVSRGSFSHTRGWMWAGRRHCTNVAQIVGLVYIEGYRWVLIGDYAIRCSSFNLWHLCI